MESPAVPCTPEMIAPHIDGVCAAIELVDDPVKLLCADHRAVIDVL